MNSFVDIVNSNYMNCLEFSNMQEVDQYIEEKKEAKKDESKAEALIKKYWMVFTDLQGNPDYDLTAVMLYDNRPLKIENYKESRLIQKLRSKSSEYFRIILNKRLSEDQKLEEIKDMIEFDL